MRPFLVSADVLVAVEDAAGILHGAVVVVGGQDLVEFDEGVGGLEGLFVVFNSSARHTEPILRLVDHILRQRLAAQKPKRHVQIRVLLLGVEDRERSRCHVIDVGAHGLRSAELYDVVLCTGKRLDHFGLGGCVQLEKLGLLHRQHFAVRLFAGVRGDDPVGGHEAHELLRGFEVGLVKAREPVATVGRLQIRIDILLPVLLVLEVLDSLAVGDVLRLEQDFDQVRALFLALYGQEDPLLVEGAGLGDLHPVHS